MSEDWVRDNWEFRKACGLPLATEPRLLNRDITDLHFKLLNEELNELKHAIHYDDLPEIADAYADLIYYAIGGALAHGIDLRPVWDEVQKANMKKTTGPKRADGKQLKPPDWVPPNVEAALKKGRLGEL